MNTKQKLKEIYNRGKFKINLFGLDNDGNVIIYKNKKIISFINYFTRLLAYGTKDAEEYIKDNCGFIVELTEVLLNHDVKYMEKCKNIEEAIDNVLTLNNDWIVYWPEKETFNYVLDCVYNNKKIDNRKWGW